MNRGQHRRPSNCHALLDRSADNVKREAEERLLAEPPGAFRDVMPDLVGHQFSAEMLRDQMLAVQSMAPLD